LKLKKNNIKALFRRAVARRNLGNYKGAFDDLNNCLSLEKKNQNVEWELERVSLLIKEKIDRKRIPIEEV
jgi:tetratricopeptide (TPR) repeat protein